MEYDGWDPQSNDVSPLFDAIVNAKTAKNDIFVHIFGLNMSAMIRNLFLRSRVAVGDLVALRIKFNRNSNEKHKSRHEVVAIQDMDVPSSIRKTYTETVGNCTFAVIEAVIIRDEAGFTNDLLGKIVTDKLSRSSLRSKRLVARLGIRELNNKKIGVICIGIVDLDNYSDSPLQLMPAGTKGVIRSFNIYEYMVWSPQFDCEVALPLNVLKFTDNDYLGKWISFNRVRHKGNIKRIEGNDVQPVEALYSTDVNDNRVEIYVACETGSYHDGNPILFIEGTQQLVSYEGLETAISELTFPRKMWLSACSNNISLWKISIRNFQEPAFDSPRYADPADNSSNMKMYASLDYPQSEKKKKGLIFEYDGNNYSVWCADSPDDVFLCSPRFLNDNEIRLGRWISFYNTSPDFGRQIIQLPVCFTEDLFRTRINAHNLVEIEVTCDFEENEDANGNRVYSTDEVGRIIDLNRLTSDDITLPFQAWVCRQGCTWVYSKNNRTCGSPISRRSNGCMLPASASNQARNKNRSQQSMKRIINPIISPAPAIVTRQNQAAQTSSMNNPGTSSHRNCDDLFLAQADKMDGGTYTDDDTEYSQNGTRILNTSLPEDYEPFLISSSTSPSDTEDDMPAPSSTDLEMEGITRTTSGLNPHVGKSLRDICLIFLDDKQLCDSFKSLDSELFSGIYRAVHKE